MRQTHLSDFDFIKNKGEESKEDNTKKNENTLIVFTDGSAINNSRSRSDSKAGYGVVWPFYSKLNIGNALSKQEPQTNNRAEFTALIVAYEQAAIIDPSFTKTLHVYTDSKLLIDSMVSWRFGWKKNNWKKSDGSIVKNLDLLKKLDEQIGKRKTIFKHVRAHTGKDTWEARYNDMADRLARESTN